MFKLVALAACCGLVIAVPIALASGGQNTSEATPTPSQPTCDREAEHSLVHRKLARKNWRESKPLAGVRLSCTPKRHIAKHRASLRLYREYRQVAPYRCHSGSEGFYAIPCYIISCESHFSWFAANPSGAVGVYQLLGWGAPYPARTFRQRLANHRIAAGLSLSNWVCA